MTKKTTLLLAAVVVAALAVTAGIASLVVGPFGDRADQARPTGTDTGETTDPGIDPSASAGRTATEIGEDFLADWVDDDGRVVRRDQGDDTVSEGQAYGMLVAAAVGDERSFDSIWQWTEDNLVRPDGLLAWQWDDGAVVDDGPASDADVDAARALVVAGDAFDRPEWTAQGVELGSVVLDTMTAPVPDGLVLLPGLWAQGPGPWSYNPSYASPASFEQLGEASGDPRWDELAAGSRAVTTAVLDSTALPSDWAQVQVDGSVVPLPSADGSSGTVQYSYDAGRLALRYAESCQPADVALAARLAPVLSRYGELPMQLDLGGQAVGKDQSPLAYVARAAAHASAGDPTAAEADLRTADQLSTSTPTYYGSAWAALGALQLETTGLGACSPMEVEG
ncbi:endoglucanase [Frigoribacterium sp. PhB160]|uniref:glycosyl hydrolase family 8 n=1 Tax=Frigoribacterium sp. PhB160 TaxID=2485192 RepID=UPI000F4987AA|nr:glycosyl hydrolase family 8 [Frigoribacterium sp. PhB160]ROS59544.1 endoglucanase [Frigoribacterium sp. PhB160]